MRGRGAGALLLAALLLSAGTAAAQDPEALFRQANDAYVDGRFDDAVRAYRTALQFGVQDLRLEYNLGNAEFRSGRLGRAILHFERARRLDPTDRDTLENLSYARSFCFDVVPVEETAAALDWVRRVQDRLGSDRQAWAAVVLIWCICALLGWGLRRAGAWRAAHGWLLGGLLAALLLIAGSWSVTHHRLYGKDLGVVLADAVEVRAGPGPTNPTLFTVHEGLTVEVRDVRQEWIQVSLPNGLHGWLSRETLGLV